MRPIILFSLLISLLAPIKAFSGEPIYLTTRDFVDSVVTVVYGYANNERPCNELMKLANRQLSKEDETRRFECIGKEEAMRLSCEYLDQNRDICKANFLERHSLLRQLVKK
jgi:hypothetical protein